MAESQGRAAVCDIANRIYVVVIVVVVVSTMGI